MVWKDRTKYLNFNLHSSGKTQRIVVQENAGNPGWCETQRSNDNAHCIIKNTVNEASMSIAIPDW